MRSDGELPMKEPGPDHPITIEPNAKRVRVVFNGKVVAESARSLVMREAKYPPVVYLPREDADASLLERTDHTSHCPYKGDASYFSIHAGDRVAENAIWTYEQPYPAMAEIKNYLAFYPNRVDAIEEAAACRPRCTARPSIRRSRRECGA
jgi:uncharacterized protein (DUF427 family)